MGTKPSETEWETVAEASPTRVIFDTIGDEFVGTYKGVTHIDPDNGKDDPFDVLVFEGTDGELYSMSGTKLMKEFSKIEPGRLARITYVKDLPSGKGNPFKDFKVELGR
jgi:hypothetical protein